MFALIKVFRINITYQIKIRDLRRILLLDTNFKVVIITFSETL